MFRESTPLSALPPPSPSTLRLVPSGTPLRHQRSHSVQKEQVGLPNSGHVRQRLRLCRISPLGGTWGDSSACILIPILGGGIWNPDTASPAAQAPPVGTLRTKGRGETRCPASTTLQLALPSPRRGRRSLEPGEARRQLRRLTSPCFLPTLGSHRLTVRMMTREMEALRRKPHRRPCGRTERLPY